MINLVSGEVEGIMSSLYKRAGSGSMKGVGLSRFPEQGSSRDIEGAIAWSRRDFLRGISGGAAAATLSAFSPLLAMTIGKNQKAVVVTFGGGNTR